MKFTSLPVVTATLVLLLPPLLSSTETGFSPSLQFSTGLAGGQNKLTWTAAPGARYRIRSSSDLSPDGTGAWRDRDIVEAEGTSGSWLDPEPAGTRAFYQVEPPQPEVFSVDPAVLSPGGVLVISGQCLPPGSSVVFEIEGIPNVTAPIVVGADGRMTATLPAFEVVAVAGKGCGPHVKLASIVAPGGGTVCVIGQTFEATLSGFASDPPSVPPPASPLGMAINEKGLPGEKKPVKKKATSHARMAGGGDDDEDCDGIDDGPEISGAMLMPALMKAKEKANKMVTATAKTSEAKNNIGSIQKTIKSRSGHRIVFEDIHGMERSLPGEVSLQRCDLRLVVPAGPPLAFVRTYRSMNQPSLVCGTGWDHCYNVHITPLYDSTTLTVPTRVAVHTGDGRVEVMHRQADGMYRCDGSFREGRLNPDTSFTLTFADQSKFIFCPLVGAPWQGRIGSIVDRNGVALTCTYSASGQLSTVRNQFGQSLALNYDATGQLSSVADQTRRFVSFSYYAAGEPGGNPGDLKSVSCPINPGQAPVRGPESYTYSTGSPDPRLNSNLLTVMDGASRLQAGFIYATAPASSASYDRVVTCDRFSTDPTEPVVHFSYEFIPGSGGGAGGLLCIGNDEMGRVTEMECSRMHEPLRIRNYTTFANPGIPVTSTTNRPPAPSEATEPAFLQTSFTWNPDHLCTRCTEPDGLQTRVTYDRELRKDCPRRECGNARVVTIVSPDPSEAPRTVTMDYLPGVGTSEGGKKGLNAVNVKLAFADQVSGGGIWAGEDGDGGCTEGVCGNPIGGLSVKGGKNPGGNLAGRAAGPGDDDDCDSPGDDWTGSSNPIPGVGIVVKRNPGGSSAAKHTNPLYEASGNTGDNPLHHGRNDFRTRLTTTTGQVFTWGYDKNGNCTSSTTPILGSGAQCTWNSLGQLMSVTILNGPASSFRSARMYDPATHYMTGDTVDPDVNGTGEGLSLTTSYGRNALGLITEVTDPRGNNTLFDFNACDQVVSVGSPPLGADPLTAQRVVCTQFYDKGGLPVRCDLEHRDASGSLMAANPNYTGFCIYNNRGVLVQEATEQKPVDVPAGVFEPATLGLENFDAVNYTLNAAGECVRVVRPSECRNQTAGEICDFSSDALGRLSNITFGGLGTPGAVTMEYSYNLSSQLTRASLVLPPGTLRPSVTYSFDAWRRPVSVTDAMGNVTSYSYANDGFVTVEVHGELNDVPGSAGNVLLARGRGRCKSDGDCDDGDDDPSPLGMAINEKGLPGEKGTKPKKSHARTAGGGGDCDDRDDDPFPLGMAINEKGLPGEKGTKPKKSHARTAGGPAFFDVFTSDDVWTWERFAPGEPAPHATETTTVHHSPAGLPLSVTRNGDVLYLFGAYDGAARLIAFAMPGSCSVARTLDACGNVTASTVTVHSTIPGAPPETFTTASTYDQANRHVSTSSSMGNTHSRSRDSLGRVTSETLPGGLTVSCAYDVAGSTGFSSRVVTADLDGDGLAETMERSVTLGGICSSATDALGYTWACTCDAQSRPTRIAYPDGTFEAWTYNALGHLSTHQRRSGAVIACDFDYKARARTFTVTGISPDTVAVAPAEFSYNGLDQCVRIAEGTSIVLRGYDSLGNRLSESQNGHTVTHTYNHRGCSGTTYPGGERFSEVRSPHGLLLSLSIVSAGVIQSPPLSVRDYQGFACVREVRRNGVVTTCDYRSDGEPPLPLGGGAVEDFTFGGCVRCTITGPDGAVLENHITRRNADQCETQHHRVFGEGSAPPSRRQTFTLDQLNRVIGCVTQVREVAGGPPIVESDVHYILDARGQRISATGGRNPGVYTSSDAPPLFDRQMGQYSSWPGGTVIWRDDGDLAFLGRPTGGITLVYDGWSRLVQVLDANGAPVADYAYDACSRRISSTLPGTAGQPPATTFFLYDGPDCIQELDSNGVPEMTFAVSGGIKHCIITKNGSTYYPQGGSDTSTAFVFPILPAWPSRLEPVPVDDDITMTCRTAPGPGPTRSSDCCPSCLMLTTSTGAPLERFASDDSCRPIILNSDGLPTGAAASSVGYRYVVCYTVNGAAWCPESGLIQCPGGVYSPELGQPVSQHKTKPKPKPAPVNSAGWDLATNKKV